jgi:competence protein ComEC
MNPPPITKKEIVLSIIFSLLIIVFQLIIIFSDKQTKIIICNVGQGDASYIRIHNKFDVLIDAGPDNSVLNCLGHYMPFIDKNIELVILTHPDKDHIAGLIPILSRYKIKTIILPPFETKTSTYNQLKKEITKNKVKTITGQKGLSYKIDKDTISVLSPNNIKDCSQANECSVIALFTEKKYTALFTGDATIKELLSLPKQSIQNLSLLKIPHHGSKNGLSISFFKLADPIVSVISVGKNNSYGHPAKEVLDILKASKTKIQRTDTEGDIIFKIKN